MTDSPAKSFRVPQDILPTAEEWAPHFLAGWGSRCVAVANLEGRFTRYTNFEPKWDRFAGWHWVSKETWTKDWDAPYTVHL